MARYTGPKWRKSRRYGADLWGNPKSMRRAYPPGPRPIRRRKISDRGQQLIEKQKVRFAYGLMEKQFRRLYEHASRRSGVTGDNLMQMLEERLDNIVFRMGFAETRPQARQLVTHGHISVNGAKLDVPSARVRIGQEIGFTERGERSEYHSILKEQIGARDIPGWIDLDRESLKGRMISQPGMGDWDSHFVPSAVVEYYSR
ncbi:MAG: 30S ribosomal protein S4 [Dehalococcoidia bacterium]|jgi:small subunit ribosomal protein S4|nr:30S ribosomal protein S4 [Dehalococcoidia bacterium]|tara:strand:- start:2760 stop:3362 length:603 start_codon:yes stop_codon:yes gene_type:complete